ncbi:tautomerase family protein [Silvibacterium acidisoli]|uniref:tautomerase family protein n=1 Tax=Acidobacteriaceae bacterium ZG23-2 TaxID=2883246 RepID=UPI00406CB970
MPLVRISVHDTMAPEKRKSLPTLVYEAMRKTINIPAGDLFVALTAHAEGELVVDPSFSLLGAAADRTGDFVLVHITMRAGRTTEMKQSLYKEIVEGIGQGTGIAPGNVMIVIAENGSPDWSFAHGEAQFVLREQAEGKK